MHACCSFVCARIVPIVHKSIFHVPAQCHQRPVSRAQLSSFPFALSSAKTVRAVHARMRMRACTRTPVHTWCGIFIILVALHFHRGAPKRAIKLCVRCCRTIVPTATIGTRPVERRGSPHLVRLTAIFEATSNHVTGTTSKVIVVSCPAISLQRFSNRRHHTHVMVCCWHGHATGSKTITGSRVSHAQQSRCSSSIICLHFHACSICFKTCMHSHCNFPVGVGFVRVCICLYPSVSAR